MHGAYDVYNVLIIRERGVCQVGLMTTLLSTTAPHEIVSTQSSVVSPSTNTKKEHFVFESRHLRTHFHNCDVTLLVRVADDCEERQRRIDVLYFFRVETEELDLNPPLVT